MGGRRYGLIDYPLQVKSTLFSSLDLWKVHGISETLHCRVKQSIYAHGSSGRLVKSEKGR